ncbi:MAG TPA: hypothetical protein VJS44_03155 [Pyrinomonadaceae bacterium]|nr:hypothetical protein [Pyrinomonadaceae bacterium]
MMVQIETTGTTKVELKTLTGIRTMITVAMTARMKVPELVSARQAVALKVTAAWP